LHNSVHPCSLGAADLVLLERHFPLEVVVPKSHRGSPKTCQGAAQEKAPFVAYSAALAERIQDPAVNCWAVPCPAKGSLHHFPDFQRGSNRVSVRNALAAAVAAAICVGIPVAAEAPASDGHASAGAHTVGRVYAAGECNDHLEETADEVDEVTLADLLVEEDRSIHYWHHCTVDIASEGRRLVGLPIRRFAGVVVSIDYQLLDSCCANHSAGDGDVGDGAASRLSFSSGENSNHLLLVAAVVLDFLGSLLWMASRQSAFVDAGVASEFCDGL